MQGYILNNFPLWKGPAVRAVFGFVCCYICMNASTQYCIVKNSFYAGAPKMPTSSPRALRKGDLAHCASERNDAVHSHIQQSAASSALYLY